MASVFTRIVSGELPCHKIHEDERFLAFLEIKPLKPGHTLVIPKHETDYIFDLEDRVLGDLMAFAKKVAKAIKKSVTCRKVGVLVYGLEVPHAHVHLVPIDGTPGEIDFSRACSAESAGLAKVAALIKQNLA